MKKLKAIISIAGSDCMGGAGIQADLKACSLLGLHCLTAVTAVTAQNSKGVKEIFAVNSTCLEAQLNAISEEINPDVVKIGMMGSEENVSVIKGYLRKLPFNLPIVIDPVIAASSGGDLWERKGSKEITTVLKDFIKEVSQYGYLFLTPNLKEARKLVNDNGSKEEKELCLSLLDDTGIKCVILTGGDTARTNVTDHIAIKDINGKIIYETLSFEKSKCMNLHGTGCTFSSLFASFLALEDDLEFNAISIFSAFEKTEMAIHEIISNSIDYKLGNSTYGPLNVYNNYIKN